MTKAYCASYILELAEYAFAIPPSVLARRSDQTKTGAPALDI